MRDINGKTLNLYVINNAHIDCEKNTYEVWNESTVKLLNDEIKIIMNEGMKKMWNEDKNVMVKYSKSVDVNESIVRILISRGLSYFATVIGNIKHV